MADEKDKEKKFAKDFLEKWARAEREEGSSEEALAREEEAVREDPNDAQAWFRRGILLADLERWADALASFDRAESLDAEIPRIHLAKSYVLSRLGRQAEAADAYRKAVQDLAVGVDTDLAREIAREQEVEEALAALAEDLRDEGEAVEGLAELESLAKVVEPAAAPKPAPAPDEDYEGKVREWESVGYDVAPLREVLAKDPDRVRTAFFQFEQNVRKIELLRETVNALDPEGLEDPITAVRRLFRAPYQIWAVEAEMAKLLEKAEARDRIRRARVTPSPKPIVVPKPRMPSAVNGRRAPRPPGQVNGLINGVRGARAGLTNGLTNGLGFTNGLAAQRFAADARGGRGRILLIPLIAILLLSITLFVPPEPGLAPGGIRIDGDLTDWTGVSAYTQGPTAGNPSVDLAEYRVVHADGHLSLYLRTRGPAFDTATGVHLVYVFLDADGSATSGYDEGRVGAEYLLETRGGDRAVRSTHVWEWTGTDARDWNGWKGLAVPLEAEVVQDILEMKLEVADLGVDPGAARLSVHLDDQEGARSSSGLAVGPTFGALSVAMRQTSKTITGVEDMLILDFTAVGTAVNVTAIDVARGPGTPPLAGFAALALAKDETRVVALNVDTSGLAPQTLLEAALVGVTADRPVTIAGTPARAYVDSMPTAKIVDGLFEEWRTNLRPDVGDVANPNVNLRNTSAEAQAGTTFLYAQVAGTALGGHPAPVARAREVPQAGGPSPVPPVPERRVGEDLLLAYFDAPSVPGGVSVGGLVADTLLEVRGAYGLVRSVTAYAWEGAWVARGTAAAIAAGAELEGSLAIPGRDLSGAGYVIETRDWRRQGDRTEVEGVRGIRRGPDGASFLGSYRADLPAVADGTVRFAVGSASLAWTLPTLHVVRDAAEPLASPGASPLEVDGYRASYEDPYPGLSARVEYASGMSTLKETLLLGSPPILPAGAVLRLDVHLTIGDGLLVHASGQETPDGLRVDGDLSFVDGRGLAIVVPPPFAEDADGARIDLAYVLSGDRLLLDVPGAWLATAAYPLAIDPTVTYTLRNDGPSYKKGEQLGYSVAVGDFNGDGYADVLAGAPFNSLVGTNVGYAYIYYGPFTADRTTPDVRLNGTAPTSGRFGISVAAGKFNNDQYWDALVARQSTPGLTEGNVSIYYGSATLSGEIASENVKFVPPSNPQNFGWAVAAGNIDNANYDDVLIGEPGRDHNADSLPDGAVYLYLSPFSATVTSSNFTLKPSTNGGGQMGKAIAVGKIDSDQYVDIVVGEPNFNSNAGRVQFYKGSNFTSGSGDRLPSATLSSQSSAEQFGTALSVGRLNGDAYLDLVVGAPFRSTNLGAAYLYTANSDGTGLSTGASPAVTILNQAPTERLGNAVLIVDFDDDGTPGVAIAAYFSDAGGTRRGRVYWFDDPLTDQTPDETLAGSQNDERFGQALAGGRFASDTRTILAIGAFLWDKIPGNPNDNDGRAVVAQVPEPATILAAGIVLVVLAGRSVQRRRLVRKG